MATLAANAALSACVAHTSCATAGEEEETEDANRTVLLLRDSTCARGQTHTRHTGTLTQVKPAKGGHWSAAHTERGVAGTLPYTEMYK